MLVNFAKNCLKTLNTYTRFLLCYGVKVDPAKAINIIIIIMEGRKMCHAQDTAWRIIKTFLWILHYSNKAMYAVGSKQPPMRFWALAWVWFAHERKKVFNTFFVFFSLSETNFHKNLHVFNVWKIRNVRLWGQRDYHFSVLIKTLFYFSRWISNVILN